MTLNEYKSLPGIADTAPSTRRSTGWSSMPPSEEKNPALAENIVLLTTAEHYAARADAWGLPKWGDKFRDAAAHYRAEIERLVG